MYGSGNIAYHSKQVASGGGGGAVAANDGLTVAAGKVRLGQDIGAAGNPAVLLDHLEIPMGGKRIFLGLNDGVSNVIGFDADQGISISNDTGHFVQFYSGGLSYLFWSPDPGSFLFSLGTQRLLYSDADKSLNWDSDMIVQGELTAANAVVQAALQVGNNVSAESFSITPPPPNTALGFVASYDAISVIIDLAFVRLRALFTGTLQIKNSPVSHERAIGVPALSVSAGAGGGKINLLALLNTHSCIYVDTSDAAANFVLSIDPSTFDFNFVGVLKKTTGDAHNIAIHAVTGAIIGGALVGGNFVNAAAYAVIRFQVFGGNIYIQ